MHSPHVFTPSGLCQGIEKHTDCIIVAQIKCAAPCKCRKILEAGREYTIKKINEGIENKTIVFEDRKSTRLNSSHT